MALLVQVDLAVPFAPCAEGSEHTSLAAHVTEGSLAGTVRSRSTNTGDTRDGATSSPRLGRVLVTLSHNNSMGLATVLVHVSMDEGDNVVTDGCSEDSGHLNLASNGTFLGVNTHNWAGSHLLSFQ